ncbi:peptidylprolyl isomerase [Gynurincola endophyticus]|uniref:peptidylprolyl isomerase n=1 Tax=Gynurincola endophyticus TaxID=2479004 RepID=UPI000F8EBBE9|nr:peptidylprolyl isomerase [Gynurincola endophyticus]
MKTCKKWYSLLIACCFYSGLASQTLFSIGNQEVSLQSFEQAYKENIDLGRSTESKKEFLETFINYQLKVKEAYSQGLDRSFVINNELNSYKEHLLHKYRYDIDTYEFLIEEAKTRAQTDIKVSYIVVPVDYTNPVFAESKIKQAHESLKNGLSFQQAAEKFSEDPTVQQNQGEVGYITAFTLPYKIENHIYQLKDNEYTVPFRHGNKWYIFKRDGSKKSEGKIQVQQIALYYPGEINQHNRDSLFTLAQKIKKELNTSFTFDDAVTKYHSDPRAIINKGLLNAFGTGEYDSQFEQYAFSLKQEGQISQPFETSFGVHILKLVSRLSINSFSNEYWQQRVETSDRISTAFEVLNKKIEQKLAVKRTDSAGLISLLKQVAHSYQDNNASIDTSIVLATYAEQSIKIKDWQQYFEQLRRNRATISEEDYYFYFNQLLQQRLQSHYRNNMDRYEPVYAKQVQSFKESTMLFELMQANVWNKNDSATIQQYYRQHQSDFKWKPYAKVLFLSSLTDEDISSIINKIQTIEQLKKLKSNDIYFIHTSKEDLSTLQLPEPAAGKLYPSLNEGVQSLVGIESIHKGGEQKTFEEALIDVTNAYQKSIEDEWMKELKQKYPVKINKKLYKKL